MNRRRARACFIAASIAVLAALFIPLRIEAQAGHVVAVMLSGTVAVLGVSNGHTIYKNADGMLFYLEPRTGDVKAVAPGLKYRKLTDGGEQVTILEIDQKGNVLQKNAQGVAFYLNRKTGARVFVKWPK